MATPEIHAVLSASSSHRWLNCPPSAVLATQFPSTTTDYAEAGTLAHAIGELKVRGYLDGYPVTVYGDNIEQRLECLRTSPHYAKAMEDATDEYLDFIKSICLTYPEKPFVTLENRVDYSDIAPGGFGTSDCIIIAGEDIHIIDYKNGSGVPVEAEDNPQLKLYAWGALRKFKAVYGLATKTAHLHIVQPHAGGIKSWSLSVEALTHWAETTVKPVAELAAKGEGEHRAGDWCRFCPAKAQCRARAEHLLSLEAVGFKKPPLLSDTEVGEILNRASTLEAWAKDLKEYAFKTALSGGTIPGFKLVEGRGSRDWSGTTESAFEVLKSRGVEEAMLFERKPVSVAGLEKTLGKKYFAENCADLVVKHPGKPTLVPESDKRPPYNPAERAFEVVGYE